MRRNLNLFLILVLSLAAFGCASIVSGRNQDIPISSSPSSAKVVITDQNNSKIFDGSTPATVSLKRGKGYFSGQDYNVTVSAEGCEERCFVLESRLNGWYLFGNLVFGGLIGWLIVDPATGAMWKLDPEKVDAPMVQVSKSGTGPVGLHIVLLEDVPVQYMSAMSQIQ